MFDKSKNIDFLKKGFFILFLLLVFSGLLSIVFFAYAETLDSNSKSNNNILGIRKSSSESLLIHDDDKFLRPLSLKENTGIEPLFSTFLGGNDSDEATDVCVDNSGNIYMTGHTSSSKFPILNAYDASYNGGDDVFLAKFSTDGSLKWSTFIGGNKTDKATGVFVDVSGNVYITGITFSLDFPIVNTNNVSYNGGGDMFLMKFSPDGKLEWSTLLGGSESDYSSSIFVGVSGNIYVSGKAYLDFPTLNAYDSSYNGGISDGFLVKFSSNGSLIWSTFIGGEGYDYVRDIYVDASGHIYIVGDTYSGDFPVLRAYDSYYNGGRDGFLAKFSDNGSLEWSTYIGGTDEDWVLSIFGNAYDSVYLTGTTRSVDLPVNNAYDDSYNGGEDVFLAKFSNNGTLQWCTYFGASGKEGANNVFVDNSGDILISGYTGSLAFPKLHAYDSSYNGGEDVFLAEFSSNGSLQWSTYFGGGNDDINYGLFEDISGNIFITGATDSNNFPTFNAYDDSYNGNWDVFLTKFTSNPAKNTTSSSTETSSNTNNNTSTLPSNSISTTSPSSFLAFSLTIFVSPLILLTAVMMWRKKLRNNV